MTLSLLPADKYGGMPIDTSPSLSSVSVSKAAQACIACRKQKRKCDKTLPMCSLCSRMGRQCDYTDTPAAPTAEDLAVLQARLAELENRLSVANANSNAHGSNGGSPAVTMSGMEPSPGSSNGVVNNMITPSSLSAATDTDAVAHNNNGRPSLWASSPTQNQPSTGSGSGSGNNFPSAIFLDIDCFKWSGMHIPRPNLAVPPEVHSILNSGSNGGTAIQDSISAYFETIHPWWPIISRKRMTIGTSLWEGGPDLAMLFLAMKLITSSSSSFSPSGFHSGILYSGTSSPAEDPIYISAKQFLSQLEASGCLSLPHLQAMILVTLYEIGHGIYPSAWMSVATCARYIEIIGLPSFKESSVVLGSVTTWTELEERRRCWWAVYVLDRFICLGNKKRCVMPEPEEHAILPVDDDAWDRGDPARGLQYSISTELTVPQAPFARVVQGAMLIGSILAHCRSRIASFRRGNLESEQEREASLRRVDELINTIETYTRITIEELKQSNHNHNHNHNQNNTNNTQYSYSYFSRLTPACLSISSKILLHDAYACPETLCDGPSSIGSDSFPPKTPREQQIQIIAVEGLKSSSLAMRDLSLEILEMVMLPAEQRKISPLCLDSLYCAVASLHWLFKESGEEDIGIALGDVRNCLGRLGCRWKVGEVYAGLMGFHDVTVVMALRNGF
ncbi:Fungal specific transcription factor domain containing protein [Naviculisporaceae sp. PSN 640]